MTTKELKNMSGAAKRKADYDKIMKIISEGQEKRGGILAKYTVRRVDDNDNGNTIMIPWIYV